MRHHHGRYYRRHHGHHHVLRSGTYSSTWFADYQTEQFYKNTVYPWAITIGALLVLTIAALWIRSAIKRARWRAINRKWDAELRERAARPRPPPPPGAGIKQRVWGNMWKPQLGARIELGGSELLADDSPLLRPHLSQFDGVSRGPILAQTNGETLAYTGEGHLLTVAPPGTGKSTGPVAVNLIGYFGSIVVTDPKGELAALTAKWRQAGLRQEVHIVDPWGIVPDSALPDGRRATFNPLDLIPGGWDNGQPYEGLDSADNAFMVAAAIIMQGSQTEPHWDSTAKALLSGILLAAAVDPEWNGPRTLPHVNDLLAAPPAVFRGFLEHSAKSQIPAVAAEMNQFLDKADKEASSIRSNLNNNMRFLQSAAMRQVFSGSTLDWSEVKRRRSTVYLCIPPERINTHAQFLRLMFSTAITEMTSTPPATWPEGGRWQPVLFLMDEFANLGKLDKLVEAYALMRGYGLKLWAFVQDLGQLKRLYGDGWETFIGSSGVIQAFGNRDRFTSEYLSAISGNFTQGITSTTYNSSMSWGTSTNNSGGGTSDGGSRGETKSTTFSTTPLLYPSDFRELPATDQIMFIEGNITIQHKMIWYKEQGYSDFMSALPPPVEQPIALPDFTASPKLQSEPRPLNVSYGFSISYTPAALAPARTDKPL